jgi:hypothetical protein
MAIVTIIDFEDQRYPTGTIMSDQYGKERGITFMNSRLYGGGDNYGYPMIEQVRPGNANSGKNVLVIKNCSGEFCKSLLVGKFNYTRHSVQVIVGETNSPSISTNVTLSAFDSDRKIIASTSKIVTGGAGIHTLLQVSSSKGDIDTFEVRGQGFLSRLAIDDLQFDNSDTIPSPDFGLSRIGPPGDGVRQGFSATAIITLNRINGSSGDILFEASNLPSGVTASFFPNPTSTDEVHIRFNATPDALKRPEGVYVTITGTPQTTSAGAGAKTLVMPLIVAANFALEALTIDVPHCTRAHGELNLHTPNILSSPEPGLIPAEFSGTIELSLYSIPPGVDAKLYRTSVYLERGGHTLIPVSIALLTGSIGVGKDAFIQVEAKSPPFPPAKAVLTLHKTAGWLDRFLPNRGSTPQSLLPGTEILLVGGGFCPGDLIQAQFGNSNAKAKVTSLRSDGELASVRVPRLATFGPLTVITPYGSFTSKEDFIPKSYRNTNGFAFENNFTIHIGFDDLTEAFGKDQTYITFRVDVCSKLFFGLFSCEFKINIIKNPLVATIMSFMAGSITNACFGMSLTSERLLKGEVSFGRFMPTDATNVRQLYEESYPWDSIRHYVKVQSAVQLSSEIIKHWLNEADLLSVEDSSVFRDRVRDLIKNDLKSGNYPLISMIPEIVPGNGHTVVAYDLEEGVGESDIAYYIYIYDPNTPFVQRIPIDENDPKFAGGPGGEIKKTHLGREQTLGRIPVYNTGRFDPPSNLGWSTNIEIHGHLVVFPYEVIPRKPTALLSPEGMINFVMGSATIVQITDAENRTLFSPDGRINNNPSTRLKSAVAPWVPWNGSNQLELAESYMIGTNGYYKWMVKGTGSGKYSNLVLSSNFSLKLDNLSTSPASTDEISVDPTIASFGFHTNDYSKPLSVSIVDGGGTSDNSFRTAVLRTTSYGTGNESLSFNSLHDTLLYTHHGEPTTFTLTLGWTGNNGPPTVFTSEPISIGHDETATFHPTNWVSLNQSPVELTVIGQHGITISRQLLHSIQETAPFTIDDLRVVFT